MKSLKKTLSLALVFVMAIGLMISASAADFTDVKDVQYTEAVQVMTNIGAIAGFPDGSFQPDGLVTRAQAAKMIATAALGPKVAANLKATGAVFTDVPATYWGASYIEFCASRNIVSGRGAGKFDPNGNVTTYELAKMILAVTGYGKNSEYVGASWIINVAIDATDKGAFTGLVDENYADPATREEAALMIFNGISKIDQVVFSADTKSYKDASTPAKTIGEQKYDLTYTPATVNGVSGYAWKNSTGTVSYSGFIVTDNVLGTSMKGVSIADLSTSTKAAYIAALDTAVSYYYNGNPVKVYATATAYSDGDYVIDSGIIYEVTADKTAAANTAFGTLATTVAADPATKGVIVNFVDTNYNAKADKVTVTAKAIAQLSAAPVVNADKTITIAGICANTVATKVPGYETLAKDDVVLWYLDNTGVYNIEKTSKVNGTVTAIAGTKYYIDGVAYEKSGLTGQTGTPALGNTTSTYYLDNSGYVAYIVGPAAAPVVDKYALVLDYLYTPANSWAGTAASSRAKLLLSDGTVGVYSLVTNSGKVKDDDLDTTPGVGGLINYVINDSGVITSVTASAAVTLDAAMTVTNKAASTSIDTTTTAATTYYVSSSTVFFFYGSATNYGVAIGFAKVPTTTSAAADKVVVEKDANNVLKAVVMPENFSSISSAATYVYVANATPVQTIETINGVPTTVYTYDVFLNGAAAKIKMLSDEDAASAKVAAKAYTAVETDGYYDLTVAALDEDDATVNITEATYFVAGGNLYKITAATQIYKATLTAGAVTNLEKADLALVTGKTLKVDVVEDGTGNALYVIFWYV